jgi:mannose-6-phosphate isomerase-like protein (cupin superfamily)
MISKATAEHYLWGDQCDGWKLVNTPDLTVIQERMPPGTSEVRHYHQKARQFFFILSGQATFELSGERETIGAGQGLEVPPKQPHQILNETDADLEFLVISQPTTARDRVVTS